MSTTAERLTHYHELTVSQARVMRADQARLAALYADRAEQARAADEAIAAAHWLLEYKRSIIRCRLLGERIRRDGHGCVAAGPERTPTPIGGSSRSIFAPRSTQEAA